MYLEPWKTRFHAFCAVGISYLKNHMKQKTTYAEETRILLQDSKSTITTQNIINNIFTGINVLNRNYYTCLQRNMEHAIIW